MFDGRLAWDICAEENGNHVKAYLRKASNLQPARAQFRGSHVQSDAMSGANLRCYITWGSFKVQRDWKLFGKMILKEVRESQR